MFKCADKKIKVPRKYGVRLNGFDCPPHPLQLLAVFVFLLDFFTFYLVSMTSLSHHRNLALVCSLIFGAFSCSTAYFWAKATGADPSDPTIRLQRICELKYERFPGEKYEFMCQICDSHVLQGSKHCGACNRCVNEFDHHCRWINNCVGGKNYHTFLKLITFAFTMALCHNITNAVMLYYFMTED